MKQTLEHSVILPLIGPIFLKVCSLKCQSHAGWWRISYNDVTSGMLCVVFNSDCRILKVTWVSLRLKSSALDCRLLNTVSSWQRKSHQSSALLALCGGNNHTFSLKWPEIRKPFPCFDVILLLIQLNISARFCCVHFMVVVYFLVDTRWWRHQMEAFSALLACCEGNPPATGEFPNKGQWRWALLFSLICAWKKTVEQIIETPVIWDATPLIMTSLSRVINSPTFIRAASLTFDCHSSTEVTLKGMINMMTSSNGNIFHVTGPLCGEFTGPGEFPTQRPVTRSFDVFFDVRLIKRLSKHSRGWWFETLSHPLWRHRNEIYRKRIQVKLN